MSNNIYRIVQRVLTPISYPVSTITKLRSVLRTSSAALSVRYVCYYLVVVGLLSSSLFTAHLEMYLIVFAMFVILLDDSSFVSVRDLVYFANSYLLWFLDISYISSYCFNPIGRLYYVSIVSPLSSHLLFSHPILISPIFCIRRPKARWAACPFTDNKQGVMLY